MRARFLTFFLSGVVSSVGAWAQPAATLVVLNKSDDTAALIDLKALERVATLPTGRGPHECAASPDGRLAVASNYEDREHPSLTVFDVVARAVRGTIELPAGAAPHGLAFLPGGAELAVTCEGRDELAIVDVEGGRVSRWIGTGAKGSHMVVVTPDGSRAFVPNLVDGSVSVIDLGSGRLEKIIVTGPGAEGVSVSPDGSVVCATNRAGDSVSFIDARLAELVETVACAGFPIRCVFTGDGAGVLVSCATSGEVAVFDASTRRESRRVRVVGASAEGQLAPIGILVAPGGRAFVANSALNEVAVLDLETGDVVSRLSTGRVPDGMALAMPAAVGGGESDPAGGAASE